MKANINIETIERKTSKTSGKAYWKAKTQLGWMSIFDKEIARQLEDCCDNNLGCSVEYTEKQSGEMTYRNITAYLGDVKGNISLPTVEENTTPKGVTSSDKNATMYTSYAKDIFIAMHEEIFIAMHEEIKPSNIGESASIMQCSIDLVKQARDAFS